MGTISLLSTPTSCPTGSSAGTATRAVFSYDSSPSRTPPEGPAWGSWDGPLLTKMRMVVYLFVFALFVFNHWFACNQMLPHLHSSPLVKSSTLLSVLGSIFSQILRPYWAPQNFMLNLSLNSFWKLFCSYPPP
jgi:hypothetical protein